MSGNIYSVISRLQQQFLQFYEQGRYQQGIEVATQMCQLIQKHLGEQNENYAMSLSNLATLYCEVACYEEAEPLYRQALEILRTVVGEYHPGYATGLNGLAGVYWKVGNYIAAIQFLQQAMEICRVTMGKDHPKYAISLNNLAVVYKEMGDYAAAEPLYLQAMEISRKAFGENHPNFALSLNNLAGLYEAMGNYKAVEPLLQQAVEVRRKTLGEDHPHFANSLNNLAGVYKEMGEYTAAEPLCYQAMEIRQRVLGENHPDFAQSLNNLGILYREMGNYAAAEPLFQQAIEACRRTLGEAPTHFATCLNDLALLCEARDNYGDAISLYRRVVEIRRAALGEDHPDFVTGLDSLTVLLSKQIDQLHQQGEIQQAIDIAAQVCDIIQQHLGRDNPAFALTLRKSAMLYQGMGDYWTAELQYKQAADILRASLGEEHPTYSALLNNLATLYHTMGDYKAAASLHLQALEICRKTEGENSSNFAIGLSSLGATYHAMGNFKAAELILKQAVEISRLTLEKNDPHLAASLNNLAELYLAMGNYVDSEPLYRQALEIHRATVGKNHPNFALILNNLGSLYRLMGNYEAAESHYRQAMEIVRAASGENHPDLSKSLNNLGGIYKARGKYTEAEQLYHQSLEIRRATLGEKHPAYALGLNNLAMFYESVGNYAAAEPLYRQALEIRRTSLGELHPYFAVNLFNLAKACVATAREEEAMALMEQATAIDDYMIGQVFSISSESQRAAYLETILVNFDLFLSLVVQHLSHHQAAICAGLNLVMRRKAIRAEALAIQRDTVLGGKYPRFEPKLRELATLRMQIVQKTLAGPGPEGLTAHSKLLAELGAQKGKLEAELAKQIPDVGLEQKLRVADRQSVALALPIEFRLKKLTKWLKKGRFFRSFCRPALMNLNKQSVLVEFVRFKAYDFKAVSARGEKQWESTRYLAFILFAGEPDNVKMIDLGEAGPIDWTIALFRARITGEDENRSDPLSTLLDELGIDPSSDGISELREAQLATIFGGAEEEFRDGSILRQALFDPILAALGGRKRLLLAPDSDLTRLPFEALPTDDGRRLIDDYQISYLSTGRDVLRFGAASSGQPAAAIVAADPDFNLGGGQAQAQSASTATGAANGETATASRAHRVSRELDRASLHFNRLPGTRVEGERIAEMLGVQPWLADQALEARLKSCRSPSILHLATHGFFLADQQRDPNRELRGPGAMGWQAESGWGQRSERMTGPGMENPLLRSGLALAGANTFLEHGALPPEAEDGILTAEDVSGLDLLATELVVLSACETGLGEVRTGEGVFGLRRAFVLAGAKTLVMSLWKVPDDATRELMEEFYRRILAGEPRAEALRQAQLEMKKRYPDPFYWGAFICQGDPGPLPSC